MKDLGVLRRHIVACKRCPRLVHWREEVALAKTKRFQNQTYWGKPVPGCGDPRARLLLVGLAPAAHGGNRTGRMFTGDRSGNWLYRALHKFGFASQAVSESANDGLRLTDCYITAACRCAPPANKLLPEELRNCRPFLLQELKLLSRAQVVIGLGKIGFDAALQSFRELTGETLLSRPRFSHGAEYSLGPRTTLLGSFHPSQQNTFTGRLTEPMFDSVFRRAPDNPEERESMNSGKLRLALIVAGLFFILGLFRINDLSLYTDSTRYLVWGHSLSELRGFVDDTQPVPNRFVMNAPLYPLLLVPVQWIFPFSVEAAKIWTLLWGSLVITFLFLWLQKHFSRPVSASLTLFLALNPLFLTVSTEILSEAPFMAFMGVILLVADDFFADSKDKRSRVAFLGCIAAVMLLREVGAALVAASLVILFRQKRGKDLLLAGFLAGGLFLLWTLRNSVIIGQTEEGQTANIQYFFQHFVTSQESSLLSEFLTRAWLNIKGYAVTIGGKILYPFPDSLIVAPSSFYIFFRQVIENIQIPLLVITAAGAAVGIREDLRSGPSGLFRLITLVAYILIVLLYPVHEIRFFLPLLPLLLFYLAHAWQRTSLLLKILPLRKAIGWLVLVMLLAPNAAAAWEILRTNSAYRSDPGGFYRSSEPAEGGQQYFNQPWSLIGDWIRAHCPEDAVIASPVKEIAPFVYPRRVLETSRVLPTPVFERFLRDFDARYLLTVNAWDSVETFQYQMPESRRLWFEHLSSAAGIRIYRIHSAILEPPLIDGIRAIDTATARGLLLEGRKAMLAQRYLDALGYFGKCLAKNPTQPEIAFQIASALSFLLGDSVGAMNMVEQLFTHPRATAYTQSAQSTLAIMEQTLKAKRFSNPSQRAFALFETGLAFWGLGYREAARSIIRNVIRLDSTNFVGALWGIHFARELGDTLESNRFLERLKRIDRSAQIVGDWEEIRRLGERLRKSRGDRETAGVHLALARVYAKIELFDEALDATLRALKLEPGNVDTWLYKGEVMEKKKTPWGAAAAYREVLRLEPHNSFAKARLDSLSL